MGLVGGVWGRGVGGGEVILACVKGVCEREVDGSSLALSWRVRSIGSPNAMWKDAHDVLLQW